MCLCACVCVSSPVAHIFEVRIGSLQTNFPLSLNLSGNDIWNWPFVNPKNTQRNHYHETIDNKEKKNQTASFLKFNVKFPFQNCHSWSWSWIYCEWMDENSSSHNRILALPPHHSFYLWPYIFSIQLIFSLCCRRRCRRCCCCCFHRMSFKFSPSELIA